MEADNLICERDGCNKVVLKRTHNQKYCSDECCRIATNIKIKERYRENKDRLSGKRRACKTTGCKNTLSRYNESRLCSVCEAQKVKKERNHILEMIKNVVS